MDTAQTDLESEAPVPPQEERTARHLRMLARAADVHMEMIEATRTEALEAPQPGVDYGQRIAVIAKSLRLTLLLEEKVAHQRDERRKAAARREAAREHSHGLRVALAMMAAVYESSEDGEEDRRADELSERMERPEVVELVEASPAPVAVAALCRRWGYPVRVEQWLEMADEAMEHLGFLPPEDGDPEDPPEPRCAAGRRPTAPDTG